MRVIQLIDALDFGDGVSNVVMQLKDLLDDLGIDNQIYSKWFDDRVAGFRKDIDKCRPGKDDLVLYHYSGKSSILEQAAGYSCRRLIYFHNMTPPKFFRVSNPEIYRNCVEGLEQLKENIQRFDGFWAVSPFNASDLISYGADPAETDVFPPYFDFERLENAPYDKKLLRLLQSEEPYILFVGRVSPNKRFEDILDAFENYYRYHDKNVKLYLVGNREQSSVYTDELYAQVGRMAAKDKVVFTGKVTEEELYAYYRGASAFLCMSEHEGFCMPLLEAQHFGIPTIGYAACAVPDTMGESGVLLYKKDPALTACLLDSVLHDEELRISIVEKQRENLEQYRRAAVRARLEILLQKWGVK